MTALETPARSHRHAPCSAQRSHGTSDPHARPCAHLGAIQAASGPRGRARSARNAPLGAWSGSTFIGAIVVILIVLSVILYGVSKTVIDTANTTTSAPPTTGQGSPGPTGQQSESSARALGRQS